MTKFLFAAFVGFFIPAGASATTWYVAETGNDSHTCLQARQPSTPKRTIPAGLACVGTAPGAGAGDTVEVGPGTYAEAIINLLPSGTSWSSPFTLKAETEGAVTIRAGGQSNIILTDMGTPEMYSIIDGFVLDGTYLASNQIAVNGPRFVRFTNLEIVNTTNWSAIYTGYSSNLEIINNSIHDGPFLPAGFGHAIYIQGSDNLIEGNILYNLPAFGVHIYGLGAGPSNNIVRGNVIYDFALNRVTASGILLSSGDNNQAHNNIVFNGRGLSGYGGVGITASGSRSVVYNNTVYNNTWIGIDTNGSNEAVIKNNIVFGNGIAFDHTATTSLISSDNLTSDPRFNDAAAGDFTLQPASPAIDGGTATITSTVEIQFFLGSAPDIGAFEYGADAPEGWPSAPANLRLLPIAAGN
jgi:parallel beta-helix repeat protein